MDHIYEDYILSFAIIDSNIFAAGTEVISSSDNGNTWNSKLMGLDGQSIKILYNCGSMLIAGTNENGIYISMHGSVKKYKKLVKNRELGKFLEK